MGRLAALRGQISWPRRRLLGAVLALVMSAGTVTVTALPAQAQVKSAALQDPRANIPRTAAMAMACDGDSGRTCQDAVVDAIDTARAAEGVVPLVLPSYYNSLGPRDQLLVLANLERADRGLPGFSGLSSQLNARAQQGAESTSDPVGPSGAAWGSNWAGGEQTALLADYDWMYDDGPGSPNLDCTKSSSNGCWGHRRNVLADYGVRPSMGAGVAKVKGVVSMTELFSSAPAGQLGFRLPEAEPASSPPVLVTPPLVELVSSMLTYQDVLLTVNGFAPSSQLVASVSGDGGRWSVSPTCQATGNAHCQLLVGFVPVVPGTAMATVTVSLAGHVGTVQVNAYVGQGIWQGSSPAWRQLLPR